MMKIRYVTAAIIAGLVLAGCGTAVTARPSPAVTRTVVRTVPGPVRTTYSTRTVPATVECVDLSGRILPARDAGAIGGVRIDHCTMTIGDAGADSADGPALVLTDTANGTSATYPLGQPITAPGPVAASPTPDVNGATWKVTVSCLTQQCTSFPGAGPGNSTCGADVGNQQVCVGAGQADYRQALQELGQLRTRGGTIMHDHGPASAVEDDSRRLVAPDPPDHTREAL